MPPDSVMRLVSLYQAGYSIAELSRLIGSHHRVIVRELRAVGVRIRTLQEAYAQTRRNEAVSRERRRMPVDETFFDSLDTEAKLWVLGVIASDGYVGPYELTLAVAETDIDMVEKVRMALGSKHKISISKGYWKDGYNRQRIVRILIGSVRLARRLADLGFKSPKSFTAPFPNGLSVDDALIFCRGAFDGDGSISFIMRRGRRTTRPEWSVSFCGSRAMVEGFAATITARLGANFRRRAVRHQSTDIYYANYSSNMAKEVAFALYAGASMYLNRKMELAERMCGQELRDPSTRKNV